MARYDESGLQFDLPDGKHFRFAALASYVPLSGQHLKEMDFAWLHDGRLVLLEVKDFNETTDVLTARDFVPVRGQPAPRRFDDLVSKVNDSILMLLAGWSCGAWGKTFTQELPTESRKPVRLVLAVALDLPQSLKVHLPAMRIALNERLRGRLKLANVENVALMDYDILVASPMFAPYVSRVDPDALPTQGEAR